MNYHSLGRMNIQKMGDKGSFYLNWECNLTENKGSNYLNYTLFMVETT